MRYIFDVDNTLAPSSQMMTEEMQRVFEKFAQANAFYLTSGSDMNKMKTQVPAHILDMATALFPVLGGQMWVKGQQVYAKTFEWPDGLKEDLDRILELTECPEKTGDHIQNRGAMVCFSTVGKAAGLDARKRYVAFDEAMQERKNIVATLSQKYPDLELTIGGETSIDISMPGHDKSQVLPEVRKDYSGPLTLFGDKTMPGGNDRPLAEVLKAEGGENMVQAVDDWQHTLRILSKMVQNAA